MCVFLEPQNGQTATFGRPISAIRTGPSPVGGARPNPSNLALLETVAEMHPEKHLWPEDQKARRVARSICAEMHSGFQALRAQSA